MRKSVAIVEVIQNPMHMRHSPMLLSARTALILTAISAWPGMAQAQRGPDQLVMGVRAPIVSLDPAISGLGTMHGYYQNIYDSLVQHDSKVKMVPGLATSWRVVDDLTWEFKLRPGVKCHDGTDFTAQAVVDNIKRLPLVPNSDNLTAGKLRPVKSVEIVDPQTVRFHTSVPYPGLLAVMPEVHLMCESALARNPTTETINSGRDAIGTGPFRSVSWTRGNRWELERFDGWWDRPSEFKQVTVREIPNDASRMASLQAGDIDVADYIPPLDVKRLSADPALAVFRTPGTRTMFLGLDQVRDQAPGVTDNDGKPLPGNPFKDERVRRAFALGISEDLILSRVMEGLATKATQGIPEGLGGYADLPATPYDPARAKAQLAEAGYPNGFRTKLSCPNDRYVNDAAICQTIGAMLARIGVGVQVDAMPTNVYMPRLTGLDFGFYMLAWGNNAGDAASLLRDVMETRDKAKGTGSWNMSISMPDLDAEIDKVTMSMNLDARNAGMKKVMATLIERQAYIPLHTQFVIVATRKGIAYQPNGDEASRAIDARKQ